MPGGVEIELAPCHRVQIDLGDQNALFVEQRTGKDIAQRIKDHAATAHHDAIRISPGEGIVFREIFFPQHLATRKHEGAPFEGDVFHCRLPAVPVVGGGGRNRG